MLNVAIEQLGIIGILCIKRQAGISNKYILYILVY